MNLIFPLQTSQTFISNSQNKIFIYFCVSLVTGKPIFPLARIKCFSGQLSNLIPRQHNKMKPLVIFITNKGKINADSPLLPFNYLAKIVYGSSAICLKIGCSIITKIPFYQFILSSMFGRKTLYPILTYPNLFSPINLAYFCQKY
jgi:hypothetical protein